MKHQQWHPGLRVGLRTETWGIALAEQDWVIALPCHDEPEPCDDPISTTLGVERRARLGMEQALGPLFLRIEGQAQKVFGMNVSTFGALIGAGFSFGGPRLPLRGDRRLDRFRDLRRHGVVGAVAADSTHHAIEPRRILEWRDCWDLLGIQHVR